MQSDIVVGLQYGDEGKGKIVDHLIKNGSYTCCIRFNGGPNAGHTVYFNDKKLVTHQVPTGAIHGIRSLIGASCMIDPVKLEKELQMIEEAGVENIRDLLHISYNCHLISPKHIHNDVSSNKVGTTGCGMGPSYVDKYNRVGTRVQNIGDRLCGCKVINPLDDFFQENDVILFEGAQGFLLDINWGQYPYVTSTHCDTGFVVSSGVSFRTIRDVYGIAKLYSTYVGTMKYQPNDDVFDALAKLGNEFGSTTGRPRQCDWLDIDELMKSINVNGVNILIINKCDVIDELGVFKVYKNREIIEFKTKEEMLGYIENSLQHLKLTKIIYSSTPNGL
jgi:adenylosuccinate synthase